MILYGIFFTAILLFTALPLVGAGRYRAAGVASGGVTVLGLFFFPSEFVVYNGGFVLLVAAFCDRYRLSFSAYMVGFVLASGMAYGLTFFITLFHDADRADARARLRQQYPVESLEDRLSYEAPARRARVQGEQKSRLSPAAMRNLEAIEERTSDRSYRSHMLNRLHTMHKGTLERFVDSPGFGAGRRIQPTESNLILYQEQPPVPLPVQDDYIHQLKLGQGSKVKPAPSARGALKLESILELHRDSVIDFSHAEGFGWVPERRSVAGFRPHQFKAMPSAHEVEESRWKILRVELVSLLKHDHPAVYLSRHLPRMDELREARTRPVDVFEQSGLPSLHRGEDLHVSTDSDHLRVMGAIRAGQPCLKCHDAQRGDLLGAFSYVLRKEQPSR